MATANMNERFPDVTEDQLEDQICIVCREEMTVGKRLPCGHILHFNCLLIWLQRQQTCPLCRTSVLATPQVVYQAPPNQAIVQQPQAPPQQQPQQQHQYQHQVQHQAQQQMEQAPGSSNQNSSYGASTNDLAQVLQAIQVLQVQMTTLQEQIADIRNNVTYKTKRGETNSRKDKEVEREQDPNYELRQQRLKHFSQ
eukprot:CAMPEP_0174259520 /NCGR_PEP_ID=MMETSP0439-20130205/8330_1 /TAXON_ID=0 /ORGANISM="Stereomyxa ramosa, Strain Chinc5" /LENGTH=195 /DNA_ID=CAMNT_0015343431 /DNA_START=832 /DNA_END=1419 /DNA_ORIENTATION=-